MLENDSPLDLSFTDGFLFTGATAFEVESQQKAQEALQQPNRWTVFSHQQNVDRGIAQGPHLYYNGAIWQLLRMYDDNAASFMPAFAPHSLTQSA